MLGAPKSKTLRVFSERSCLGACEVSSGAYFVMPG